MINGLKAAHTSEKMIGFARMNDGLIRKDPTTSIHPLVRVHPVTGERSIFLNAEFGTGIIGLKDQESDMILKFLIDHICMGHDFQARVQWEKDSVVMMDGRNTIRMLSTFVSLGYTTDELVIDTATVDYDSSIQARHIFRLASMTEKPISVGEEGGAVQFNGHKTKGHISNGHS